MTSDTHRDPKVTFQNDYYSDFQIEIMTWMISTLGDFLDKIQLVQVCLLQLQLQLSVRGFHLRFCGRKVNRVTL